MNELMKFSRHYRKMLGLSKKVRSCTFLLALLFSPCGTANNTDFDSFIKNDLSQLNTDLTCLHKKYFSAVKGNQATVLCNVENKKPLAEYYNMLADQITAINSLNYKMASNAVENILDSTTFLDYVDNEEYINSLSDQAYHYANTRLHRKGTLFFKLDMPLNAFITDDNNQYMLDTGTAFAAMSQEHCITEPTNTSVVGVAGVQADLKKCLARFGMDTLPLLVNESDLQILGAQYILSFTSMVNKAYLELNTAEVSVPFYFDGNWIFFEADILFDSSTLERANICLDSGASESYLSPRFNLKFRDKLRELPILNIASNAVVKGQNTLGKLIPKITIKVENTKWQVEDIPVFFRHSKLDQCDVVVGFDVLQHLTKIDILNRKLFFNNMGGGKF